MIEILVKIYQNRYLIVVAAFVSICTLFYIYFLQASSTIDRLETENTNLKVVVQQQIDAFNKMRKDYDDIIKAKDELGKEIQELQERQKVLEDTLYRENRGKKSLEQLATKKTSLIERMINRATEKVFQCFVEVSKGGVC